MRSRLFVVSLAVLLLAASCGEDGDEASTPQPGPDATVVDGGRVAGIDVSHHQGDIDWVRVRAAGFQFAFIRATFGSEGADREFNYNVANATGAGMLVGAYHYATPATNDAANEARFFVQVAGNYMREGYLRPVLDLEENPSGMGRDALSDWVHEFMSTVESEKGVVPLLYTFPSFYRSRLNESVSQYDLWISNFLCQSNPAKGVSCTLEDCSSVGQPPSWQDRWEFWQYCVTDPGVVPGISTRTLLDVFNGTEAEIQDFVIGCPAGSISPGQGAPSESERLAFDNAYDSALHGVARG